MEEWAKSTEVWKSTHREIDSISISPFDSSYFALSLSNLTNTYWDGEIVILQKQSNDNFLEYKHQFTSSGVSSVAWVGDSSNPLIVAGGDDGNLSYLSLNTDMTGKIVAHDKYVTKVEPSPDNKNFLSSSADSRIILWELSTEYPLRPIESYDDHKHGVNDISWRKASETFASVASDGTVLLWNRSNTDPISSTKLSCEALSVCWSDLFLFVGKVDGTIDVLDSRKFDSPVRSVSVNRGSTNTLHTISPSVIASGSSDGTINILNFDESTNNLSPRTIKSNGNICSFDSVVSEKQAHLYSVSWEKSVVLHNFSI